MFYGNEYNISRHRTEWKSNESVSWWNWWQSACMILSLEYPTFTGAVDIEQTSGLFFCNRCLGTARFFTSKNCICVKKFNIAQ